MITNKPQVGGPYLALDRRGRNPAPPTGQTPTLGQETAKDQEQILFVPPLSSLFADCLGNYRSMPIHRALSVFNLLPNATSAAAGKDDLFVSLGVGTEVIARATKGGVNVKTQVTSPANSDDAMLTGLVNNGTGVPISAAAQPRLVTRVALSQLTLQLFSATFDQTFTSVDPTASAGEGAGFVFDPTNACTTGLAAAVYQNNWLLYQKVNGADVFVDSGIPVVASVDYDLEVYYDANLFPNYLINGNRVGGPETTGIAAGTSATVVQPLVGVKIVDLGTPAQHDFDCRFISVERFIG